LYADVKKDNRLIEVQYVTVFEYLLLLELCCKALNVLKGNAMIFAAAAVSDFYIPHNMMAEHKIQSRDIQHGELQITLQQTPKMLGKIKSEWCPQAMLITFKLESDKEIIFYKVSEAFRMYHMDIVVSNLLTSYEQRVHIHERDTHAENLAGIVLEKQGDTIIEVQLIDALVEKHKALTIST
jgi:phosphopantothenate-cysteine ligase